MSPNRYELVHGRKVEEFYWNGRMIVYVDNRLSKLDFEGAVKAVREDWLSNNLYK